MGHRGILERCLHKHLLKTFTPILVAKLILKAAKSLSALEIQLQELPSLPQLFVLSLQAAMKEESLLFFRYMMLLGALRKTL